MLDPITCFARLHIKEPSIENLLHDDPLRVYVKSDSNAQFDRSDNRKKKYNSSTAAPGKAPLRPNISL